MFRQTVEYGVEVDEDGYFECPECGERVNESTFNKHKCPHPFIDFDKGEWSFICDSEENDKGV